MHALNDEDLVRESSLVAGDHIVGIHLCLNVRFWTGSFGILRREGCFRDDYSIREKPRFFPRNSSFGEIMRAMSAQLSLGEFYPPMHKRFCHHGSDAANGLINRRARSQVTCHSQ